MPSLSQTEVIKLVDRAFNNPVSVGADFRFDLASQDPLKLFGDSSEYGVDGTANISEEHLGEIISSTYDLSWEGASSLNIPVFGGATASSSSRVVVYEWSRFTEVDAANGGKDRWGFAIRFCLTVSKSSADVSMSLPYLAAEAQLGQIEAGWNMQVKGISGAKIEKAILPPKELNVETFVLARQSLLQLVGAISDTSSVINPVFLLNIPPATTMDEYKEIVIKTFVVASLAKGKNSSRILEKLGGSPEVEQVIRIVYHDFGATLGVDPDSVAIAKAQKALSGVQVRNI